MASVAGGLPEHASAAVPRRIPWAAVAWFTLLLIAGSSPILKRLAAQWADDGDMGPRIFRSPGGRLYCLAAPRAVAPIKPDNILVGRRSHAVGRRPGLSGHGRSGSVSSAPLRPHHALRAAPVGGRNGAPARPRVPALASAVHDSFSRCCLQRDHFP